MDPSVELAFLLHFCPLPLLLGPGRPSAKGKVYKRTKSCWKFRPTRKAQTPTWGISGGGKKTSTTGESIPVRSELTIYPPGR
jgi:hypothetical protein